MTSSQAIHIHSASADNLELLKKWLKAAGLPIADLEPDHMQRFLLASADDSAVGMIGLEAFGSIGLLRSLVVEPAARSAGVGAALVSALEHRARSQGIRELWLLTIDADDWFERSGYTVVDRLRAPTEIRGTAEFSDLCPGDAVLMQKDL